MPGRAQAACICAESRCDREKVHRRGARFDVLPTLFGLVEVDTDFVPPLGLSLLDARQPSKQVVYDSPYLHSVLRRLLLGLDSETRVCAGDGIDIVSVERAQIRIDDRVYTLSHNGVPRLPDDEVSLMLRLSDQGTVRYTELVRIGEMKRRLKKAPGVPHLLVFPRDAFSTQRPLGKPDGELVLYVGRWNAPQSAVVRSLDSIEDLALPEGACPLSI